MGSQDFPIVQLVTKLIWKQGIQRQATRAQFWQQLWVILQKNPRFLSLYLGLCAAGEHFWEYRLFARARITQQLGYDPLISGRQVKEPVTATVSH